MRGRGSDDGCETYFGPRKSINGSLVRPLRRVSNGCREKVYSVWLSKSDSAAETLYRAQNAEDWKSQGESMTATLPQIEIIVAKANLSPTPDNCQPWEFEWDGETLSVFHLADRAKHPLNPAELASIVTLGCLVESIDLAASEHKLKTICEAGPFSSGPRARWAAIRFGASKGEVETLAAILTLRATDRRLYNGGTEVLAALTLPSQNTGATAHKITNVPPALLEYILDTEQFLPDHRSVLPGIMQWVRFSLRHARESGDGLSWRNMLVRFWEVPSMMIMKALPVAAVIFRPAIRVSHRSRTKAQLLSSAGAICVSIKQTGGKIELTDLVDAGRLMLRNWLKLNEAGFGVQPLSLSTLPLVYRATGNADEFFMSRSDLLIKGEKILRQHFLIAEDRLPVWMIRTGLSPRLPAEMRTFRKPAGANLTITRQ